MLRATGRLCSRASRVALRGAGSEHDRCGYGSGKFENMVVIVATLNSYIIPLKP